MPRPSGSARLRLVLGGTLLAVGLADLLFMNIVLLPQVLAVESMAPAGPAVSAVPVAAPPEQAGLAVQRRAGDGLTASPPRSPPVASPVPTPAPAPAAARVTPSFSPLLFMRGIAWLSPQAEDALAKLASVLKEDTALRIRLDGHSDQSGPESLNRVLSLKRARRAREKLQKLGIAQERIDIEAHGSQQPTDTGRTAKARARNRRVEITFL